MTNKIALEALKLAGFKNPNAIAKILSYVPNPDVALEMVLDIHEPLSVDYANRFRSYRNSNYNDLVEIIGYDELANKIMYKKYTQKTQQLWYATEEEYRNQINGQAVRPNKYHDYRYVPTTGFTEAEQSDNIDSFGWTTLISNQDAFDMLTRWENWGVFKIEEEEVPDNFEIV
jgi:hypothetical protein